MNEYLHTLLNTNRDATPQDIVDLVGQAEAVMDRFNQGLITEKDVFGNIAGLLLAFGTVFGLNRL